MVFPSFCVSRDRRGSERGGHCYCSQKPSPGIQGPILMVLAWGSYLYKRIPGGRVILVGCGLQEDLASIPSGRSPGSFARILGVGGREAAHS